MSTNSVVFEREPIQTRTKSASQTERRNSVSDIADFFQSKILNSPMPPTNKTGRKTSGKAKDKEKDKERKKEIKEVKENIKRYLEQDDMSNTGQEQKDQSKGSDNQSTETEIEDMSNSNDLSAIEPNNEHGNLEPNEKNTPTADNCQNKATQTSDDEILKALKELAIKYQALDKTVNEPKLGMVDQLFKTNEKVTNLHTDIHGAVSGIKIQLEKVIETATKSSERLETMENSQKKIAALLDENKKLINELKTMQGLIQKVSQKSQTTSEQLADLTRRGMEQNLILHGISDEIEVEDAQRDPPHFLPKERCQHSVIKFMKDVLNLNLEIEDIWKAHRTGPFRPEKVRPMVIKVSYSAKDLIMEHVTKLKGLSNLKTGQKYFISEQVPEAIAERQKQTSNRVKLLKEANDKKPKETRSKIQVINNKIVVDGQLEIPEITTPQPSQILLLSKTQQQEINQLQQRIIEVEPETVRHSEFIGLALKVHSLEQVRQSYIAVAQRYPAADHIMLGYALREDEKVKSGACDDSEYGGGSRIRRTIFELKAKNVAVFVVRNFGGLHLGYSRFAVIEDVAKKVIQELNAQ